MAMIRADERVANLGVVYLEGDILARRYDSVKRYWFSEHWSEISLGISKQKCHYQSNLFFKKILILLD